MSITLRHEIRKSWGFQPWLHRNVVHLANRRIMPHMITERSEQKNDASGPLITGNSKFHISDRVVGIPQRAPRNQDPIIKI